MWLSCSIGGSSRFPPVSSESWLITGITSIAWIILKEQTVSGIRISWAMCKSAPCSEQITMPAPHRSSSFTGWMPFLPPMSDTTGRIKTSLLCNNTDTEIALLLLLLKVTFLYVVKLKRSCRKFLGMGSGGNLREEIVHLKRCGL